MSTWDPNANKIFGMAVECASQAERQSLLERVCTTPELRRRVERLLAAHESAGHFLEQPALGGHPTVTAASAGPAFGNLGDFRIIREVGRGGMGTVYEAEQISLVRRVALKVLPFAAMLSEQQLLRFKNEARSAATLHHPNIVPVYSIGCDRGTHFYAMQFIEGTTLAELIDALRRSPSDSRGSARTAMDMARPNRAAPPPADTRPKESAAETLAAKELSTAYGARPGEYFRIVARLGIQAAQALEHAHSMGVIHRDVKPANLLLDTTGNLWITDFGLALLHGNIGLTRSGDLMGTIRYMSPEQALGKRAAIDHRTDIYSLGATLYELLTLEAVFPSEDRQEVMTQIATLEPRRPADVRPGVPAELSTIVLKALAKEPAERYATARELADDLNRFLHDEPIRAKAPSLFQRARKWARRHRTVVVAATLSSVVILAASAILAVNLAVTREQTRAAAALRAEQQQTKQALLQAESYRRQAERLSAIAALDRGLHACDQGRPALGLLWLARSLSLVPQRDADLDGVIRTNIAAWAGDLPYRLDKILGHDGWVHCVAFSPDGQKLVSGGVDRTARIWDVATGRPLSVPLSHEALVYCATFSPDGALVATGCEDGLVRLWNVRDGRLVRDSLRHEDMVYAVAFSPDGTKLASGGRDGKLRIWNVEGGEALIEPADLDTTGYEFDYVMSLAYHPNGKQIVASGGRGRAYVSDANTGKVIRQSDIWGTLPIMALSPDGETIAIGIMENCVYLANLADWKVRHRLEHQGNIQSLAFTPDGKMLLSAGADGLLCSWNTQTGKPHRLPIQHATAVYAVAISSDGNSIATGTTDGVVRLWRHNPEDPAITLRHSRYIYSCAISPKGDKLLVGNMNGELKLWDLTNRSLLNQSDFTDSIHAVDFHPDGSRFLVTWGKEMQVFDTTSLQAISEVAFHEDKFLDAQFSPDGRLIVSASKDRTARLWWTDSCRPASPPIAHPHWVHEAVFAPDGRSFVTACEDRFARLWRTDTQEQLGAALPHQGPLWAAGFLSAGDTLVTGGWGDASVRLWDVVTGTRKMTLSNEYGNISDLASSPDGRTIAAACWGNAALLWDVATGKQLGPPIRHQQPVCQVCLSPDNSWLVTASFSGEVRLSPLPAPQSGTAEQIEQWIATLTGLQLTPDGSIVPLEEKDFHRQLQQLSLNSESN